MAAVVRLFLQSVACHERAGLLDLPVDGAHLGGLHARQGADPVGSELEKLVQVPAMGVSLTNSSIWMQSVLGLSPVTAGLVALPMSGASFVVSASLRRVMHRLRPERVIGSGILLIGRGDLLGFVLVRAWASWLALLPGFLVVGLGVGMATPSLNSTGNGSAASAAVCRAVPSAPRGRWASRSASRCRAACSPWARNTPSLADTSSPRPRSRTTSPVRVAPTCCAHCTQAHVTFSPRPSTWAVANGIALLLAIAGLVGVAGAVVSSCSLSAPRPRPPKRGQSPSWPSSVRACTSGTLT